MKKKLIIATFMLISFGLGLYVSSFFYRIKNMPLLLCHKIQLNAEKKQEVLSKYKPTKNPFFNIPNWYDKRDLLKTKNFYIQNGSNENSESSYLNSDSIYSWNDNAYLEFEDGNFYKVDCRK